MWSCKLCHVSFAFESVEQHVYHNHLKPTVGSIKVYKCGECMFTAEGFEDIALHCINLVHEPTRVNKGLDFDEYASQLFTALEEIMCLNEASTSDKSASAFLRKLSEPATSIITGTDFSWSQDPTEGSEFESDNINQPLSDYGNEPAKEAEVGKMKAVNKIDPPELKPVLKKKLPMTAPNPKPMTKDVTTDNVGESESGTKRSRPEEKPNNTPSPVTFDVGKIIMDKFRLYPCAYCPKMSGKSSAAKIHERIHTGERPFQCQTCDKLFIKSDHLKIHQRVHTGEKPYFCTVCGKGFNQSSNMKTHKRACAFSNQ